VTGSLEFGGAAPNYYDPSIFMGYFVDGLGDLNVKGTTVTISGTATEFGYSAGGTTITADFTSTQLFLTETASSPTSWTQTFTDPAFAGLSLAPGSTFTGLTFGSTGDVLTISWAGAAASSQPKTYSATFNVVDPPLPEPSGLPFLMAGLAAVIFLARYAKRSGSTA
jgi:hypothetical protein